MVKWKQYINLLQISVDFDKLPCLATITLDTASGTLVPAARNVMPITESGIFNVSPANKRPDYNMENEFSNKFGKYR